MAVEFAAVSDVGRVRKINEDSVLTADPVFAVADGMGGHAAGDVASALVVDALAGLGGRDDLHPDDVLAAIARANAAIVERGRLDAAVTGMGATLAGVCLGHVDGSPHWFVFNVGDARVYRFASAGLVQVTVDHSEVQELVDSGQLTPAQARIHPARNIVTRSVGTDPAAPVDMWVVPAVPGDRYLICSDGLTGEVDDPELAEVLRSSRTASAAVDTLIERALGEGARDNVSVVVIDFLAPAGDAPADVTAPRARLNGAHHA